MSQHYREKDVPATTVKVLDRIDCDLCGNEIEETGDNDVDDIDILRSTGFRYPDGGDVTEIRYDICRGCWDAVLVPFLESRGAKPTTTRRDW